MTGFNTQRIHAGYDPQGNGNAANVPIYESAAFDMVTEQHGDDLAAGRVHGFSYSRVANPTVDVLEKRLTALEGGIGAVAVSSGMAAVSYALLAVAEMGGTIIAQTNLYGASVDALESFFPHFGVRATFVTDINDLAEVEAAITTDTKAIFAESVANPSTKVTDIEALAALSHKHGIPLIVDNTFPTPYLFRPIEYGADIVVHSTTKGISGHGNALGGVIIDGGHFDWNNGKFPQFTEKELVISDERTGEWKSFWEAFGHEAFIRRVRIKFLRTLGAVQNPFNAYLQLLGLDTIAEREEKEVANTLAVAQFLEKTPHVKKVYYSGLPDSQQADLVAKYFPKGVGTVLSFELEGDEENIRTLLNSVKVFTYIPNVGDVRSMIVNPARITHREVPAEYREAGGVTDNLIRLSIGLEDATDLTEDLGNAIVAAFK
ncbi:MAG: aminotransferase class I/II-fold pyridoxal phosphate-dependent enzyme [Bifidobacteriaceae bacterium]|jgi:O-acetylhomoserine (thiol)-lyase|nr:aminotransferase class I/II-fold pyridoxal phosphate-dependent enzyme [Bifidobacteriaceae bacterium]